MRTAIATPAIDGDRSSPVDAAVWSIVGTCILLLIVLFVGALWGPWAALAAALSLFLMCGGALVFMVVREYPPEDDPLGD